MTGNRIFFRSLLLVLSLSLSGILAFTSSKKEKEDIVRIYVSVQGNDKGKGTKNKPDSTIKTLVEKLVSD